MKLRTAALATLLSLVGSGQAVAASKALDYKLRPGADGALCLGCHTKFDDVLKRAFLHTPVKSKQCSGCHNPHASNHDRFLAEEGGAVCRRCHATTVPAAAVSTHAPVADGKCTACHDPHGSANKFSLVKPGTELCGTCHQKLVAQAAKAKTKHHPVESGCVTCHDPHGSAQGPNLLKKSVPELCVGCHKVDKPVFTKQHMNYPVQKARCTGCHDPHGSNQRGMLYDRVHSPVAKAMCSQCHEPANSPNALKTKSPPPQLCRGCHAQFLTAIGDKTRVHRPVAEGSCLACHNPHASREEALLSAPMLSVCGKCHADTLKRNEMSPTKHQPVDEGKCTACHSAHASDSALALVNPSVIETCGTCHDWLKHSSHPMGEKLVDPRNRNLTLQCLSCHRSHGTEFKHLMPTATTSDLCVKCHEQYKR